MGNNNFTEFSRVVGALETDYDYYYELHSIFCGYFSPFSIYIVRFVCFVVCTLKLALRNIDFFFFLCLLFTVENYV